MTVAEQGEQRIPVRPHRPAARAHQELRRAQPLELPADEVKPLRVTNDPRLLVTQPKSPRCQELPQLGEDDPFELSPRRASTTKSSA
jgi:hypothetical protein